MRKASELAAQAKTSAIIVVGNLLHNAAVEGKTSLVVELSSYSAPVQKHIFEELHRCGYKVDRRYADFATVRWDDA